MGTKFKQLTDELRKEIHKKLVAKADRVKEELNNIYYEKKVDEETKEESFVRITRELTAEEERSIKHLNSRQDQIQMSLRLTHNTVWIDEWRSEHIKVLNKNLEEYKEKLLQIPVPVIDDENEEDVEVKAMISNLENKIEIAESHIKSLKKAQRCKKCFQRGFDGFNISTSEFSLCVCTLNTIELYRLKAD